MRRRTFLMITLTSSLSAAMAQEIQMNITPAEAAKMVSEGKAVLIDIRTPEEWKETGVAEGAVRIDMNDPNFVSKFRDATGNDRTKPVALICRTANRTRTVQAALIQNGIHTRVMNVEGGMIGNTADKGWIARGLPVKKGE
jgi:rhodanese-related sulfurtransferase